jgi:hypothetical protein
MDPNKSMAEEQKQPIRRSDLRLEESAGLRATEPIKSKVGKKFRSHSKK